MVAFDKCYSTEQFAASKFRRCREADGLLPGRRLTELHGAFQRLGGHAVALSEKNGNTFQNVLDMI